MRDNGGPKAALIVIDSLSQSMARSVLLASAVVALVVTSLAAAPVADYPGAVWIPANSSNFTDSDREGTDLEIRWIVIHDIEGDASACISWFQNPAAKASSHYVIGYDGKVYQMVREKDTAWHAGNWDYNQHSIGIEHAGFADFSYFTDLEYRASARLVAYLIRKYNVTLLRPLGIAPADPIGGSGIIGHDQVPDPTDPSVGGGRSHHYDPGRYWNWTYYLSLVRAYYENTTLPERPPEENEGAIEPLLSLPLSFVLPVGAALALVIGAILHAIRRRAVSRATGQPQRPGSNRLEHQGLKLKT